MNSRSIACILLLGVCCLDIAPALARIIDPEIHSGGALYRVQGPGSWGLGIELLLNWAGDDSFVSLGISPYSLLF